MKYISACLLLLVTTTTSGTVLRYDHNPGRDVQTQLINSDDTEFRFNQPVEQMIGQVSPSRVRNKRAQCKVTGSWVDCTRQHITRISDIELPIPTYNVTWLDLSFNEITEILDQDFVMYENLVTLNISKNHLQQLNNGSFSGLGKLIHLNLRGNDLKMNDETFPAGVFSPLQSLRKLQIQNNTHHHNQSYQTDHRNLSYPDQALKHLSNLRTLYMDGLTNQTFDSGFSHLSLLTYLKLDGRIGTCKLEALKNDTFKYLTQLKYLALKNCDIWGKALERGVFQHLTNLTSLVLSFNPDLLHIHLSPALAELKDSNLRYLDVQMIVNPFWPGIKVTNEFALSLPRNLSTLIASSNCFESAENEVLDSLPKTLTHLDISNNKLVFGDYLKNLTKLVSLKTLKMNGATRSFPLPRYFPRNRKTFETDPFQPPDTQFLSEQHPKLVFSLPPNLQKFQVKVAGFSYSMTEFTFNSSNMLLNVSLDGNNIPNLKGPITGLQKLKQLDMRGCSVRYISSTFFDDFPSLEILNLEANIFGVVVLQAGSSPIFSSLRTLKTLNLAFTNIKTIGQHALDGLTSLENLQMQRNPMTSFQANISHMLSLRFIDFSDTGLTSLPPETTKTLDKIHGYSNLTVNFSENPIHCYCGNLAFVRWLSMTPCLPHNLSHYNCHFVGGTSQVITEYYTVYKSLERVCHPPLILFSATVSASIAVLFAVILGIIYRFRWKLRYLYFYAYIHVRAKERDSDKQFEFDLFLSYANADQDFAVNQMIPKLERKGLKVHYHQRHFTAGDYIFSNIVRAVNISRRTVVVLTKEWLKSKWCKSEFQMANMESVHTDRPVLIFLVREPLEQRDLSTELLYHIKNNTYIQYPEADASEEEMEVFWKRLVTDIKNP